jgi:hypothetical protein
MSTICRIYFGSLRLRLFTGVRTSAGSDLAKQFTVESEIHHRIAVFSRQILPGTLPRNGLTNEGRQVGSA